MTSVPAPLDRSGAWPFPLAQFPFLLTWTAPDSTSTTFQPSSTSSHSGVWS